MKSGINRWIVVVSLLGMLSGAAVAEETSEKPVSGLRLVMQGLLEDTRDVTAGIFLQDFTKIEVAAKNIAEHPKPGMATMMKVIAELGPEMGKFKGYDALVHDTAVVIATAASENDMEATITAYHQLIDGCQACHSEFKQRVTEILKEETR